MSVIYLFSVELQPGEIQASQKQKCKPLNSGKRSRFWLGFPSSALSWKPCDLPLTSLLCFPIGKRNAKKRLSLEGAKRNTGWNPEVTDSSHPEELGDLSHDPNVSLVEPKMEPQEQESMWIHSCSAVFLSLWEAGTNFFFWLFVVCAVQVKVEEMEVEIPIHPPESPRTAPLVSVKQEEDGEPTQLAKQKAVQEERVQREEAAETSPEAGCVEQNISGEKSCAERSDNMEQSSGDDCSREDVTAQGWEVNLTFKTLLADFLTSMPTSRFKLLFCCGISFIFSCLISSFLMQLAENWKFQWAETFPSFVLQWCSG